MPRSGLGHNIICAYFINQHITIIFTKPFRFVLHPGDDKAAIRQVLSAR
jgi:hypothetical protein